MGAVSAVPEDDPAFQLDRPQPSPRLARQDDLGTGARPAGNPTGPRSIPHRIDGHQLHLDYNRCLACHAPDAPAAVQATPVPDTHLRDRDGERHAQLTGGRHACTVCHVPQHRLTER
jgi:nitrate reductase (cytochrome), electron transfer subunit